MAEHREWVVCDRCEGSGGPDSHWDEDTHRWQHYVCGSCGGEGGRMMWFD